jgi:integrase
MALTAQQVATAKSNSEKLVKLSDGGGLFLAVLPSGQKSWRLKYRHRGKEKLLTLGLYPTVSLKDARLGREDAKRLLARGLDPSAERQALQREAEAETKNTFRVVAEEWVSRKRDTWARGHLRTIEKRLANGVFPYIGNSSVTSLTPSDLLVVLRRIEERGAVETAHRIRNIFGQVFRFAVASGLIDNDPSRDLRGALKPIKGDHFSAVTDPKRLGEILRMMRAYVGGPVVQSALRLAPLLFVRPGELRSAEWSQINFESAEWRFTASKTKTEHIVPLSTQAVGILKELHYLTGAGCYVFPSPRSSARPMSENALLAALRSLGISKDELCPHGFRATARTLLDEVLGFPPHLIEHQLAHAVKDSLGRAYNRTTHLPERRAMMQRWSDYLEELT